MSGVRAHTHARMSARPSEAKPKPGEDSRIKSVLRAGVIRARKNARAEQTAFSILGEDIVYKIMDMVKSPLQTCAIVRLVRDDGWYNAATPAQLLHLIKLLFFDPDTIISNAGPEAAAALAHVQQVLTANFGDEPGIDTTTTDGLKRVLLRLCEGYARALTAIRAMKDPQPWEFQLEPFGHKFQWGMGSNGLSIMIPLGATLVGQPGVQQTIDAFVPIREASLLTVYYRELLAAEKAEKEDLKARARSSLPPPLRKPWTHVSHDVRVRASLGYIGIYNTWFFRRERVEKLLRVETPSVNTLPVELQDQKWLPMYDKRTCLDSISMSVDTDKRRITGYRFFANDPFNEQEGRWNPLVLESSEYLDDEAGVV